MNVSLSLRECMYLSYDSSFAYCSGYSDYQAIIQLFTYPQIKYEFVAVVNDTTCTKFNDNCLIDQNNSKFLVGFFIFNDCNKFRITT